MMNDVLVVRYPDSGLMFAKDFAVETKNVVARRAVNRVQMDAHVDERRVHHSAPRHHSVRKYVPLSVASHSLPSNVHIRCGRSGASRRGFKRLAAQHL
jgi:hypothetical protein